MVMISDLYETVKNRNGSCRHISLLGICQIEEKVLPSCILYCTYVVKFCNRVREKE